MRIRVLSVIAAVMLVWPASARAGSITLLTDFSATGVNYSFNGEVFRPNNLGAVTLTDGSGLGDAIDGQTFVSYCVDLLGPILDGSLPGVGQPYDAEPGAMSEWTAEKGLNTEAAGRAAAWLYNEIPKSFTAANLQDQQAALQLAIWNVLYDGDASVSLNQGTFFVSNDFGTGITGLANDYLGRLTLAGDLSSVDAVWIRLLNETVDPSDPNGTIRSAQDFIGPTSVPEPGAGLLLGMGVTALAAFRSRKSLLRRA